MPNINNILIFGTQGSGKDTQAELLSKKRKVPSIVMGKIFRQEVKKGTKIGRKIAQLMKRGELVTDSLTLTLLNKRLRKMKAKKGFILNGFPRNSNQQIKADKFFKTDLAIELKITDAEALRRITGRRVCSNCGATYHLIYKPPRKKGVCDQCRGALIVRSDDRPKMVRARLKIYHQKTEPLFRIYKKRGIYREINGRPSIPKVFKEMIKKIKAIEK